MPQDLVNSTLNLFSCFNNNSERELNSEFIAPSIPVIVTCTLGLCLTAAVVKYLIKGLPRICSQNSSSQSKEYLLDGVEIENLGKTEHHETKFEW